MYNISFPVRTIAKPPRPSRPGSDAGLKPGERTGFRRRLGFHCCRSVRAESMAIHRASHDFTLLSRRRLDARAQRSREKQSARFRNQLQFDWRCSDGNSNRLLHAHPHIPKDLCAANARYGSSLKYRSYTCLAYGEMCDYHICAEAPKDTSRCNMHVVLDKNCRCTAVVLLGPTRPAGGFVNARSCDAPDGGGGVRLVGSVVFLGSLF